MWFELHHSFLREVVAVLWTCVRLIDCGFCFLSCARWQIPEGFQQPKDNHAEIMAKGVVDPMAGGAWKQHTVKEGDTIKSIARKYGRDDDRIR